MSAAARFRRALRSEYAEIALPWALLKQLGEQLAADEDRERQAAAREEEGARVLRNKRFSQPVLTVRARAAPRLPGLRRHQRPPLAGPGPMATSTVGHHRALAAGRELSGLRTLRPGAEDEHHRDRDRHPEQPEQQAYDHPLPELTDPPRCRWSAPQPPPAAAARPAPSPRRRSRPSPRPLAPLSGRRAGLGGARAPHAGGRLHRPWCRGARAGQMAPAAAPAGPLAPAQSAAAVAAAWHWPARCAARPAVQPRDGQLLGKGGSSVSTLPRTAARSSPHSARGRRTASHSSRRWSCCTLRGSHTCCSSCTPCPWAWSVLVEWALHGALCDLLTPSRESRPPAPSQRCTPTASSRRRRRLRARARWGATPPALRQRVRSSSRRSPPTSWSSWATLATRAPRAAPRRPGRAPGELRARGAGRRSEARALRSLRAAAAARAARAPAPPAPQRCTAAAAPRRPVAAPRHEDHGGQRVDLELVHQLGRVRAYTQWREVPLPASWSARCFTPGSRAHRPRTPAAASLCRQPRHAPEQSIAPKRARGGRPKVARRLWVTPRDAKVHGKISRGKPRLSA